MSLDTKDSFDSCKKFILSKLFDENYTLIYGTIAKRATVLYKRLNSK